MGTMINSIIVLFILLTGFFFLLRVKEKRKTKKLLKNYDEKENKSRRTGEGRQTGIRRRESLEVVPTRPSEPEPERLLPTATPKDVGDGSSGHREEHGSPRKVGKISGILRRIRRKGRA